MDQKKGTEVLISVRNLKKYFPILRGVFLRQDGAVKAVDGISFDIFKGETLGLVGESGCGKSTTGRSIMQLFEQTEGEVIFDGQELTKLNRNDLQKARCHMQMIFQDPYASLNPRMTVGRIISEPLEIHNIGDTTSRTERVKELLRIVGLNSSFINRYPHEFSGGQRQRIGIARALSTNPDFIVADEPISALDVSIQAQIVNLLSDLKEMMDLTYLFITHDLSMIRYISDRVAVMYLGKVVELSDTNEIFENPLHPYTKALLSAIPVPDPEKEKNRKRITLKGTIPDPSNPPEACNFHPRCCYADQICREVSPKLVNVGVGNRPHLVSCNLVG